MTRNEYEALFETAKQQIASIGYPHVLTNNYRLKWNTRASKRLGCCKKIGINTYVIELNWTYASTNPTGARNTVMHELIHSIDMASGHTGTWKRVSQIVNNRFKYDIHRTSNPGTEYMEQIRTTHEHTYAIQCQSCRHIVNRERMSKAIAHPEKFKCAKCGGKLTRIK